METKDDIKLTSTELLQRAGIPLITQVLVVSTGELVTNFDRTYAFEYYNKQMVDYDNGNHLFVTPEEYSEVCEIDLINQ
jgi:hypothetical protein